MLSAGRYLLGCAELALLLGCAWAGASRARSRLVPELSGATATLATSVLALAGLLWVAELLGTVSLLKPVPYLIAVAAVGLTVRFAVPRTPPAGHASGPSAIATALSLLVAAIAVIHFAVGVKTRLSTGMTGFDSTWYHGPFAAGFFQSGNTWSLHFIAPQFLAWFYPANSEVVHAIGMLAFGRDLLSPLLNLGWFVGCLVACWCIGRPYRVAPWSLALGAVALSVPALADQAGEARNDLVALFFLLAAVAVALSGLRSKSTGALLIAGLAAGLAAGTKLNFLLPAAVLVLGLAAIAPRGRRAHSLLLAALAALAGGGYWYLRNLVQAGNPLPWVHHLGPLTLPAPEQALGGREAHSVLGYLGNGSVWSEWFLPALHHGLWIAWPLLALGALAGLLFALLPSRRRAENRPVSPAVDPSAKGGEGAWRWPADPALAVAGLAGLAVALAWLIAPTSASGPAGVPRGFESGLRYLAPALVLGLALLPAAPPLRRRLAPSVSSHFVVDRPTKREVVVRGRWVVGAVGSALALAVLLGYPLQRHYLRDRYASPSFTTPGLDAAFKWARGISGARIATTSTRQYPFFGTDLSNRVQYVGEERPHGGFEAPADCRAWRRALDTGHYDYVVTSRDRLEPGNPPYPPQARWTEGPNATVVLRKPPTVVFELKGPLDPSACP